MSLPLVLAILAVSWELAVGGSLHTLDPRMYRLLYRNGWFVPVAALGVAGTAAVLQGVTWTERVLGLVALIAAGTAIRFRPPASERPRGLGGARGRRVGDSNQRPRLLVLGISWVATLTWCALHAA